MKNLLYIGNQLSKKDKTVTIIETLSKLLLEEGYDIVTASKKENKILRLLDMFSQIIKYRHWVDYVLIDTYSTQNFYYAYFCAQLCRLLKLKYIPILHGGDLPKRLDNSPKLCKTIFNNAHKNVAPSEYLKFKFEESGYHNLVVIPNSIELQKYSFKESVFDKPKLLWVRSFAEIYNPSLAIKVLKALIDEKFDAELCMVGPDKDDSLNKAKALANQFGVDVKFTGKLSKEEWIKRSEDYNIFINTTNFDNMPVSIIEAMALGLPIVSTNVGGLPYLIKNNKEGVLLEPNNPKLFVEAIKEILAKPEITNTLIWNARNKAEQFDWEIVKNQWNKLLI
tara:strand:+ start:6037 stop:7047 length:1011 start_codon:yes stop_codon:yes gene_type:complete